ncbi:LPS export ABC transporter periplasmic protein LptC [Methylogaea oryzae]|uniref:LPS export ABC transporter periplasmic protein LptC n=1 Tax=Methylogaea oryzae TaxID=1295382 RepID=A0A8D4VNK7_9GAMM|nr:LPS export ABC transporter periplasmic protein LptC [Methylogaea oryzae]BBL71195.1 hypothetical protein MoryE10_18010 [Methylogaea oryzae]
MRLREVPISLFAGLIGLSLVSWWLAELMTPPPEETKADLEHSIDYYAKDFIRTEMKADGTPKSRLFAVAMGHYLDNNVSEMEKPVMLFFNPGVPPWVVRANTGTISGDGNEIFLGGKAWLSREPFGSDKGLDAYSKNVTVHMDKSYLESTEFTEILNHPHYTSGTGMHTDFSDGMQINLLSDVRGRYEF